MDAQRIFGDFISNSMLTDLLKRKRIQEKKQFCGPDPNGAGQHSIGPAQSRPWVCGNWIQMG
jgi:hypothetical protein